MLREIPESEVPDNWQEGWLQMRTEEERDREERLQARECELEQVQKALERHFNTLAALLAQLTAVPSNNEERQQAAEFYDQATRSLTAISHEVLPVVS
jgi:hypothetical protein